MKDKHKDIIVKKFRSMLVGELLSSVVVSLVILTDTIIAGMILGANSVTAINLVTPAYSLAAAISIMLSLGVPILYTRAVGNFDEEEADRVFKTGLTISLISGAVLSVLFFIFGDVYLEFFDDAAPIVIENAKKYMFWIRIDVLFLPLSVVLPGMLFADGDEQISTAADFAGSVSNVILSFILGQIFGIGGVALGSFTGTVINLVICGLHFARKRNSLHPGFAMSFRVLRSVIKFSIIDASAFLFLSLFSSFINRYMLARFDPDMLILAAVFTFVIELQFLMDGVGGAMSPIMGIYLPLKCDAGVVKTWKISKWAAMIVGAITMVVIAVTAPAIPEILGIDDHAIIDMAVNGVRILSLGMPFISLLYLITSFYVLQERIFFGVVITALYELVVAVVFAVIFGEIFGIYGVFAGVMAAAAITWFIIRMYVSLRYGKEKWPLRLDDNELDTYVFDFAISPKEVVRTRDKIEGILKEKNIANTVAVRFLLVFEEMYMDIYDRNKGVEVGGEAAIILSEDEILLIEMDDGVIYHYDDDVTEPESWREYTLSRMSSRWMSSQNYIKAISFNRNRVSMSLTDKNMTGQ